MVSSLDIESRPRPQNPYGQSTTPSSTSSARLYFFLCLTLFTLIGLFNSLGPSGNSDFLSSTGDAAGGWGIEHNHAIEHHDTSLIDARQKESSVTPYYPPVELDDDDTVESFRQEDFLTALIPIITIPSLNRKEYKPHQSTQDISTLLQDTNTPHGKAYDFILNRDKRHLNPQDPTLIQRYVLTLLFYTTGGHDNENPAEESVYGWDSDMVHFLTGLHECHWVKKSLRDSFWELLGGDDGDGRVGVTGCNDEMEVTEIRLANLNLVGFIPEEIKWLSSLQSLDVQNNHIAGPIPTSLGELDELRYLSLDGNNFSGSIPDVFEELTSLERAYLNFNDFNGAMPPSLCTLREEGSLMDLWSDCGGYPITCTCCTVCCDFVAECDPMQSQGGDLDSRGF